LRKIWKINKENDDLKEWEAMDQAIRNKKYGSVDLPKFKWINPTTQTFCKLSFTKYLVPHLFICSSNLPFAYFIKGIKKLLDIYINYVSVF